jgi:hypothetical protein
MSTRLRGGAVLWLLVGIAQAAVARTQLAPAPTVQHITVAAGPAAASAAPGAAVTLWADVTPKPSIHVYAAGATDFKPVTLVVTPNPAIRTGQPTYSKPDVATAQGSTGNVPAYAKPFRITLPITLKGTLKAGDRVTVAGAVNYQACDERLCYPATSAPVAWTVAVR